MMDLSLRHLVGSVAGRGWGSGGPQKTQVPTQNGEVVNRLIGLGVDECERKGTGCCFEIMAMWLQVQSERAVRK